MWGTSEFESEDILHWLATASVEEQNQSLLLAQLGLRRCEKA